MSDFLDLIHDPKCKPRFESLLRLAAKRGDADLVAERLSWNIDPNCETKTGRTPLILNMKVHSPSAGVVAALLKYGADAHHIDLKGLTALDYANRKLARIDFRGRKPPQKSPSLDENDQLILADFEQEMLDEVRRNNPADAEEFVKGYLKERLRAAKSVFNDPAEIERSIDLLEAAMKR